MIRITRKLTIAFSMLVACLVSTAEAQSVGQSLDVPMTRLRPIGAASAVDQYRSDASQSANRYRETSFQGDVNVRRASNTVNAFENQTRQSPVRQTVMLQQYNAPVTAPQLPGGSMALPQGGFNAPAAPNGPSVLTPSSQLPTQPTLPGNFSPVPVTSSGGIQNDLAPLPQPQLGGGFATMDNCNCISAPSSYVAASGCDCGVPVNCVAQQSYVATPAFQAPAQFAPATQPGVTFAAPAPSAVSNAAPLPSLLTFGQQYNPVQVGQGILGQPVAYVPGQTFRNWLRYIFP